MLDEQPQGAKARVVVTRKREANSKETTRNLENNLDGTNANSYASWALLFQA
jgi:hypothetical protein